MRSDEFIGQISGPMKSGVSRRSSSLHLGLLAYVRYTCISDFQVSPDSVKLVLGSGDNGLHCFVENVFEKLSTKFHLNRPCFVNVMVKTFLVCFFMPHSVVSLIQVLDKKLYSFCLKNALKLTTYVDIQKF